MISFLILKLCGNHYIELYLKWRETRSEKFLDDNIFKKISEIGSALQRTDPSAFY
jgi:hypothetical protein